MASWVVVTGASAGIGAAVARAFRAEGWRVLGVDRQPEAKSYCDRFVEGSVTDDALIARVVSALGTETQCCLVNNAAKMIPKPLLSTTDEEWDEVIATNLTAIFRLSWDLFRNLRGGSIVNISSVHARATSIGAAAYAASKGGVSALTRALALELAPEIRVNAILPGAIDTQMLRGNVGAGADGESALLAMQKRTPLERIGESQDIAELALFLADRRRAANITGQEFVCDGGALARLGTE